MTNEELAGEIASKGVEALMEVADLAAETIIQTWSKEEQEMLQAGLSEVGVEVAGICQRKKASPPPAT